MSDDITSQGYQIAKTFILGFLVLSALSMIIVASGRITVELLIQLFDGLGKLAAMLGIPSILAVYIYSRGQTSAKALPLIESEIKPEKTE